jgi:CRISPR type I-D-associated protein Csc3/Cas10d
MILTDLLKGALHPSERVLAQFVETMAGPFIEQHSLTPAKGGSDHAFGKNADQSMMAHIFNGLFPTMRLLALADRFCAEPWLSEQGQRLYILGYAMHDLNQIRGMRHDLDTSAPDRVQAARALLDEELRRVNVTAFWPEYEQYLNDILFVVVNTQKKEGANYTDYNFPGMRLEGRERTRACDLCTYSDSLAFFVKNPADILNGETTRTLRRILGDVSSNRFRFVYHQFSDVRGLLTGIINNGVKDALAPTPEGKGAVGPLVPYLFFTRGIVYLQTDPQARVETAPDRLWATIEAKLRDECANDLNAATPGVSFNTVSNLSYPGYLEDLMTPVDFVQQVLLGACLRSKANVTASTRASMQAMADEGLMPAAATLAYDADDARIAIVGRFLLNFDKLIVERVSPAERRATLRDRLYEHFGLTPQLATAQAIPSKGGLDYRYYWLGAQFILADPGLAAEGEDEGSLHEFLTRFVIEAAELFVPGLESSWQGELLPQLRRYVQDNLTVGGVNQPAPEPPDFAAAFASYVQAKQSRRATLPCTLCNSPYLVDRKQADAEVLVQPWVYKNRLPLNASENAGGICAICLLEIMLRQLKQQSELRLTGKAFEETQTKFFYLYPNYFFTTETARLVRQLTDRLQDVHIGHLQRQIGDSPLDSADYLGLDTFNPPAPLDGAEQKKQSRSYYRMEYSEHDTQSLIFFGYRAGRPTASEAWAIPALLALMLPLALGCKVVVADSFLPLFGGGEEFPETVVLDAAHPFLSYLLPSEARNRDQISDKQRAGEAVVYTPAGRVRIDRVLARLRVLTRVYSINYDTYNNKGDPGWNMISRTARRIRSDPLNVFALLKMQARAEKADSLLEGYWPVRADRYVNKFYKDIWDGLKAVIGGRDPMEVIKGLVEAYMKFYSPVPSKPNQKISSASITQPVSIAVKVLLNRPPEQSQSPDDYARDIKWMMRGELIRWLRRVRKREATGRALFWGKDITDREDPAVETFVDFLYDEVYRKYCRGEAGLLSSRLNNIKSGCEAYYSANRTKWRKPRSEGEEPGDASIDEASVELED